MTPKLTPTQAVKLALDCIDSELQRLAFDANCWERFGAAHGKNAHKKRERLIAARAIVAGLVDHAQAERP